eukprot:3941273-Rhodomonas_salina.2
MACHVSLVRPLAATLAAPRCTAGCKLSVTEVRYAAMPYVVLISSMLLPDDRRHRVPTRTPPTALRTCYAMSGTETKYAPICDDRLSCYQADYVSVCPRGQPGKLLSCYACCAMSGTNIAYAATRVCDIYTRHCRRGSVSCR